MSELLDGAPASFAHYSIDDGLLQLGRDVWSAEGLHHPGQRIPQNQQYNRSLRDTWRRNVAEISRRNADRVRGARLIIRPGAPSLVTGAAAGETP